MHAHRGDDAGASHLAHDCDAYSWVEHFPDAQVEQDFASLLSLGRGIEAGDLDHSSADGFRREARACVVRAEIVHQRMVVELNEHRRRSYRSYFFVNLLPVRETRTRVIPRRHDGGSP